MKEYVASMVAGLLIVVASKGFAAQERQAARATISQVAWIAGDWTGQQGQVTFEERWTDPAGGAMLGVARTLKSNRMVAFEFLRIIERDGGLLYIAQPNGRPPTEFRLTKIAAEEATFENPAHDFPKVIRYAKREGELQAEISDGGSRSETFRFRPRDRVRP